MHKWDSKTTVKHTTSKACQVNITNTTNPVSVPLAWQFYAKRFIIMILLTCLHAFYKSIGQTYDDAWLGYYAKGYHTCRLL